MKRNGSWGANSDTKLFCEMHGTISSFIVIHAGSVVIILCYKQVKNLRNFTSNNKKPGKEGNS